MNYMTTQNMIKNKKGSRLNPKPRRKRLAQEVIALSTNHIPSIDFSQC